MSTVAEGRIPDRAIPGALRATLAGEVITPDDDAYDRARRVWNGMIDRYPAAVVRPRGAADVIECVRIAREHDVPLAVRGGGHNVAGFGTCDGGLVVDLTSMRAVRVDPVRKLARAGGGATWGDVDRETQAFGLAAPGGIVSATGIGGLTLGGGQGWLRRTLGMTCDSLVSADVVTADGHLLVASESENPDLFWALRGGGGNFGIVTSFEYRLHPVGPLVAFAAPVYPLEKAPAILPAFREFAAAAPDEVNLSATFWTLPAAPAFPEHVHGRPVIVLGALFAGDPARGEAALRPLREIDEPVLDLSAILPYTAVQKLFDRFFPSGELRYYWKSLYLDRLDDDAVAEIVDHVSSRPSSLSMASVWALGGALPRVPATDTAAGNRDAPYLLEILANWDGAAESNANIAWARGFFDAMAPFGSGKTNLNFPGLGEDEDFVRAAFGPGYDRLLAAKRVYDPTNLFRLNQNIVP
ncbi:MAG TPA: FAD-binding oxidoreductase [Longimicrobiales bacterium]